MKKVLTAAFMFMAVMSFAGIDYGLEKGQTRFGVYGGMSLPQDWDISGVSVPPGDTGLIFGAEMFNNLSPMFALGLDAGYANYGSKETGGVDIKSNVFGIHAIGRINFMPESQGRIYIPFGIGISRLASTFTGAVSEKQSQSGVSGLAGLGFEFDLNYTWTVGVEGRYFYMPVDKDKFGDSKFSSLNILLKLGARF